MTPEGRVKAAIAKYLKANSIWYFMPVSGGFGKHGIPDFICCYHGKFLGIEAKAPGKRDNTSDLQARVIGEILEHKGLVVVVDDVKQLEEYLNGL